MNITVSYIRAFLRECYPPQEAAALARFICCEVFGLSAAHYYLGKDITLSPNEERKLHDILSRLRNFEPVQYILGRSCFRGRDFQVAPGVLIPRPETEELVERIVGELSAGVRILDVGTGNGCIAVTLALEVPGACVAAWDVSESALAVAQCNNDAWQAGVCFEQHDVLTFEPLTGECFDVIVSNPPYVTESEKREMERNVLDWEPVLALFVPDADPLLFYRCIASLGQRLLASGGRLYFEINRAFGRETVEMLQAMGYEDAHLLKDLSGNDRFVAAVKQSSRT